jgi:hypothetical protein
MLQLESRVDISVAGFLNRGRPADGACVPFQTCFAKSLCACVPFGSCRGNPCFLFTCLSGAALMQTHGVDRLQHATHRVSLELDDQTGLLGIERI